MTTRDIAYNADGLPMVGRLGLPSGEGKRPAVLIAHEANGLDDFQKSRADQFAGLGYVAFALDYHGGGRPVDRDQGQARLGVLRQHPDQLRALATAALDVLLAEPRADASRVAMVGYCFGGTLALEFACSGADLKAVIGFHPGLPLLQPQDAGNITGKVLMCVGTEDPYIPLAHRQAFEEQMRAGGVDWRMNLYGGVRHSFTHPFAARTGDPSLKYDQVADARSWRAMRDLFDEVFA